MDVAAAARALEMFYMDEVGIWRHCKEVGNDGITREVPTPIWQGKGKMCTKQAHPPGDMTVARAVYCLHLPHGVDVQPGDEVNITLGLDSRGGVAGYRGGKVTAVRLYMTHDEADLEEVKVF